ncbi:MAG: ABC transporter permease [Erysipelotrichaceae bacterium]
MVKVLSLFMINLLTAIRYKINFVVSSFSLIVPILPALLLLLNDNIEISGFSNLSQFPIYLLLASTIWGGVEILWGFVFQMRSQMREGILDEVLLMPLNIHHLIIGWTLDGIISTVIQSIPLIILTGVMIFLKLNLYQILFLLILLVVTFFSSFCFGTMLLGLMLLWKEADQLVSFIGNIAPFICGVIVPLNMIPYPLSILGYFFPFTWTLDIIRAVVFDYPLVYNMSFEVVMVLILSVIYYIFGKKVFVYFHNKSRKKGGVIGY